MGSSATLIAARSMEHTSATSVLSATRMRQDATGCSGAGSGTTRAFSLASGCGRTGCSVSVAEAARHLRSRALARGWGAVRAQATRSPARDLHSFMTRMLTLPQRRAWRASARIKPCAKTLCTHSRSSRVALARTHACSFGSARDGLSTCERLARVRVRARWQWSCRRLAPALNLVDTSQHPQHSPLPHAAQTTPPVRMPVHAHGVCCKHEGFAGRRLKTLATFRWQGCRRR